MASIYLSLPLDSGGPGAGVTSFNGRTGIVVSISGDYSATLISNVPAGDISATNVQDAINELDSEKQIAIAGANDSFVWKNNTGVVESLPGWAVNSFNGSQVDLDIAVDDTPGAFQINTENYDANPTENSPNSTFNAHNININIDANNDGFQLGTNGEGVSALAFTVNHQNTSDVGTINFLKNNYTLGNGVDSIDVRGISYAYGFGNINANVNISGPIQGYGIQPNIDASATLDATNGNYTGFYDSADINTISQGHTSFQATPTITNIANNKNYTGINLNPTVDNFTGNSGVNMIGISGNFGTFDTGNFNGIIINPTIDETKSAYGIFVDMDQVTPYPGIQASITIQDLFFEAIQVGEAANDVTIEYIGGGTAGSEVVSNIGLDITVQIEDGVSTAQNVKDALDAYPFFSANATVTITGVASNPQTIQGPTNLAGGENEGNINAAVFEGDVTITGDLSFSGSLSIGQLNAFASQALISGTGGPPAAIHALISNFTLADSSTITSADSLGTNTACLITLGDNCSVSTDFIGISATALPAVVQLGTSTTVDRVVGATIAASFDSTSAGTIDKLELCKAVAIPGGTTTVNNLYGFSMDLPFGDVGTDIFGLYTTSSSIRNYISRDLLIGGTPDSDDKVTNSSVALEIKSTTKTLLNARMTTTQRDALTAVNGMMLYNSTTDKLQVYAAGAWVDLH